MADGTFIAELAERLPAPVVTKVHGLDYLVLPAADDNGQDWTVCNLPRPDIEPPALLCSTLQGFVDYILANPDKLDHAGLFVLVVNEHIVRLHGKVRGAEFPQRPLLAVADAGHLGSAAFAFDTFMDGEKFKIGLLSLFEKTEARDELIALVASIKESDVRETLDDGVSQVVTARKGVAMAAEVSAPSVVMLQPYRTFLDVTQPESRFVLRLRSGENGALPSCALFEADGGFWKHQALDAIATFLRGRLATTGVQVFA